MLKVTTACDAPHTSEVLPTSNAPQPVHDNVPRNNEQQQPVRSRRRKRDVSNWKRNVNKRLRLHGKPYTDSKGLVKHTVTEGPSCNCHKKCFNAIKPEDRQSLRDTYYSFNDFTAQRLFLCRCITPSQPKRRNPSASNQKKRSVSYHYSVCITGKTTSVCKQALASIFGIKIAKINYMCELVSKGSPGPDKRGKHHTRPNRIPEISKEPVREFLSSIPKYVSHYTRKQNPHRHYLSPELNEKKLYDLYVTFVAERAIQPVTFRTFREIFVTEFNLHFGHPRLDTCKTCDKLAVIIDSEMDEDTKQQAKHDKSVHLCRAEAAQCCMKSDFTLAKTDQDVWTLAFDLQQALPTPHIQTSVVFYSRQLWTYNLGVHDINGGSMHIWPEDIASRGSQDIASCLMAYFCNNKENIKGRKTLLAWSDSCGGQNKNKNIIAFWYHIVHALHLFDEVQHKFPIPGHTFLDCDRDFGIIEKAKRATPAVYLPDQWIQLISTAKRNQPFQVTSMTRDMFHSLAPVVSSLIFRKKCMNGQPVHLQKACRIKIHKDCPGKIFFQYTYGDISEWQEVNISRRGKRWIVQELPQLYSARRTLPAAKVRDLKKLCEYLPPEFRMYYEGLQSITPSPKRLRLPNSEARTTQLDWESDVEDSDNEDSESE